MAEIFLKKNEERSSLQNDWNLSKKTRNVPLFRIAKIYLKKTRKVPLSRMAEIESSFLKKGVNVHKE